MHRPRQLSLSRVLRSMGVATLLMASVFFADTTGPTPTAEAIGFVSDVVVGGLQNPTDFAFAADGRIFVAERFGAVRIIKNNVLLPTPFLTLVTNTRGERGVVGLALDPDFAANNYVYIYYTVELNVFDPDGRKVSRLIRVTANGDIAQPGSEVVLLGSVLPDAAHEYTCELYPAGTDCLPADNPFHVSGGMRFGPEGSLFLSVGDSAQYGFGTPLRAQHLDKLSGKMLRVNPDGTGPSDNPFYTGDPNANRSKVWQYGMRNPFRWGFWPGSNTPMIGDVGTDRWEELNTGHPGANFGWPCYEGNDQAIEPIYNTAPVCLALYSDNSALAPFYTYPRGAGAAIIGGLFYMGTAAYPPQYLGNFFFADYISDTISAIHPITKDVLTVLTSARGAVDFEHGPDGNLWYLAGAAGEVRRLRWDTGNLPPVAVAGGAPTAGLAPLNVQFSSAGTYEPEGQPLTYSWLFGDGGSSNLANPQHTYLSDGAYVATLRATDPSGAFAEATVPISVGNAPPVPTIYTPVNGEIYQSGDTIVLTGTGTDLEDGTLGGNSLAWRVFLVHCSPVNVCHEHDYLQAIGATFTFTAPTHSVEGGDYFFARTELTATDSIGLQGVASRFFGPDVNGDQCMDAYTPVGAFLTPPFSLAGSDHKFSGTAIGNHYATVNTLDPGLPSSVNWAQLISAPGTQGQELSFALLALPMSVSEAATYGFTVDMDVVGQYTAPANGSASMGVVFGAVIDSAGAAIGGSELLQLARAFDDGSGGATPSATIVRVGHPYGFSRTLGAGSYHLVLILAVDAFADTPSGASATSRPEGWIASKARSGALCQLRAPATLVEPLTQTPAPSRTAALDSRLSPGLTALAARAASHLAEALRGAEAGPTLNAVSASPPPGLPAAWGGDATD